MGNADDLAVPGAVPRGARRHAGTRGAEAARRTAARDFLAAAAELVAHGAEAITTNCGFLSLFQAELGARMCGVPVATASLMQVPWVQATLPPGKRVGIITVSAGVAHAARIWRPPACRSIRRSSAPRTAASSSAC